MRDAGIVDQNGDGAECRFGLLECARHRRAIEHVRRDGDGAPACLLDARLHGVETIGAAGHERDGRAVGRQAPRQSARPARSTRR